MPYSRSSFDSAKDPLGTSTLSYQLRKSARPLTIARRELSANSRFGLATVRVSVLTPHSKATPD